ncbi:MAG TPA: GAF domain-containing protein [Gaiellaceae bacterium]
MSTSAPPADPRNEQRLVEEQAALRRVATLVASGAPSAEVFSAVAQEVAQVMHLPMVGVYRYDSDGLMTVIATWSDRPHVLHPGTRWPLDGQSMLAQVQRTGRPARVEDYTDLPGALAAGARESGLNASAGAPIIVNGSVWGAVGAASPDAPLPEEVEDRLAEFTELVATAIANSQAQDERTRLAEEQAALRRVATLVAEGATPQRVFDAVRREVARKFNTPVSMLMRYDDANGTATLVTTAEGFLGPVGRSWPVEGDSSATAQVCRTGLPARADYTRPTQGPIAAAARAAGGRSAVGVPVVVQGALWGVVTVGTRGAEPLPADVEGQLAKFTELLATAIARSEAHEQLALLADEQAALRRVATLVAEGASPHRVFDAVRGEVARMFNAPLSGLLRYDGNGTVTQLAASDDYLGPIERSWTVEGDSAVAQVCRTGLPARADYTRPTQGSIAATARREGALSAVGVPVVVDGALWGVMAVGTREAEPLPADLEDRLAKFTQLLATAIANAEGRAELDASRARIVATADATRRRIERDLHDGAQQQLVWLALALRAAQATVPEELEEHRSELGRVVDGITAALDDLREVALGIHPAGLSEDGLTPALNRLVARSPLRVNLDCRADDRFPEPVEVTAYYVVSESLTNAAKYADTPAVDVAVAADDGALRVEVRDEGRGGADPSKGSGLLGLRDRVEAIGGTMRLTSPAGAGTSLRVELPLADQAARR